MIKPSEAKTTPKKTSTPSSLTAQWIAWGDAVSPVVQRWGIKPFEKGCLLDIPLGRGQPWKEALDVLIKASFPTKPADAWPALAFCQALCAADVDIFQSDTEAEGNAALYLILADIVCNGDGGTVADAMARLAYLMQLEAGEPCAEAIYNILHSVQSDLNGAARRRAWTHDGPKNLEKQP